MTPWCVILAGGIGSRFWPISRPDRPKQLLPLASASPLIRDTVDRILPLVPAERIRILTGRRLVDPILSVLPGFGPDQLMVEPAARGTAPVLTWAAFEIARHDAEAVMISLHADHVIAPADDFRRLLATAAELAVRHGLLFTLGAAPTRPETGYGYIQPGAALDQNGPGRAVVRFVEKPPPDVAAQYVARGYLWNTGIFVWPVRLFLEQIRQHTPEVARHLHLLEGGDVPGFFQHTPSLSVDEGLLERSDRVAVAPASFYWDDVGAWDAILRNRNHDADGNVAVGNVHLRDAASCVAWAEQGEIVAFGVRDLIIVRTPRVTLVTHVSRAPDLKQLIAALPSHLTDG